MPYIKPLSISTIMSCSASGVVRWEPPAIHDGHRPLLRGQRGQSAPHLHDASPPRREHAVLQTVQILPVDRGYEFTRQEAEQDPWRQVVLAYALGHLEVLVEHGPERQRDCLGMG